MALQHQQHQHQQHQQQQQQQRRGIRSRTVDTWLTLAGDFDAKRRVAGIYGVDFRVPEPSDAHRRTLRLLVEAASLKPRLVKKGGDIFDRVEQNPALDAYSTLNSATPVASQHYQRTSITPSHPYPDVLYTPTGDAFGSSFPSSRYTGFINMPTTTAYTSDSEFETGTERSVTPRADTDTEVELEEWIHSQNLAPSSPSSSTQSSKSPYQFRVPDLPTRLSQQQQNQQQQQQPYQSYQQQYQQQQQQQSREHQFSQYPKTRPRAPSAPSPLFFHSGNSNNSISLASGGGGTPQSPPQSVGSASGSTPSLSSSSSSTASSSLSSNASSSIHNNNSTSNNNNNPKRTRRGTESSLRSAYSTRRSPLGASEPNPSPNVPPVPRIPNINTGSILGRPRAKSTLVHGSHYHHQGIGMGMSMGIGNFASHSNMNPITNIGGGLTRGVGGGSLKVGPYGYRYPAHPPYPPPQPLVPISSGPASAPVLGTPHPQQLLQSSLGDTDPSASQVQTQIQSPWATSWVDNSNNNNNINNDNNSDNSNSNNSCREGLDGLEGLGVGFGVGMGVGDDEMGGWGRVSDPLPGFQRQRQQKSGADVGVVPLSLPLSALNLDSRDHQQNQQPNVDSGDHHHQIYGYHQTIQADRGGLGVGGAGAGEDPGDISMSVQNLDHQSMQMDYIDTSPQPTAAVGDNDYSTARELEMAQPMSASGYYGAGTNMGAGTGTDTSADVDMTKYGSYNYSTPYSSVNTMQ